MFEELKPCPFCGKKPYPQVVSNDYRVVVRIKCGVCEVQAKEIMDIGANFQEALKAMHDVTAMWNRRYEE